MEFLVRVDARHVKDADVIAGFPGAGLVGGIAVEELVETLGLERVGFVGGDALPPTAVVEDGHPLWPVVFFARPGLLVVKVEAELDDRTAHAFARLLTRHLKDAGARSLLLADGTPTGVDLEGGELAPSEEDPPVWAATADAALRRRLEDAGVPPLDDGVVGGGAAAALLWAEVAGLPSALLAAPARPSLPDVKAAAAIVTAASRVLGLDLDAADLRERGEELERAWKRILDDARAAPRARGDAMYT